MGEMQRNQALAAHATALADLAEAQARIRDMASMVEVAVVNPVNLPAT